MRRFEGEPRGATTARLIALLRRGRRSVEELAASLGRTDNAVRAQLQSLQREGIARAAEIRRDGTVGKPAVLYDLQPSAEPLFSRAYAPVLTATLEVLAERMPAAELDALLRTVGERMARGAAEPEGADVAGGGADGDFEHRVRRAAAVLADLGADAELERTADGFAIRGHGCPLSAAVRVEPGACHAIEALLGTLIGAPVRECCDRAERPSCRFRIAAPAA